MPTGREREREREREKERERESALSLYLASMHKTSCSKASQEKLTGWLRAEMVDTEQAAIMLETFHFLQEQGCINFGVPASSGECDARASLLLWTAETLLTRAPDLCR